MRKGISKRLNPIESKVLQRKGNKMFRAATASMQGYRASMEDEHTVMCDIPNTRTGFFGLYDGHGGGMASRFCASNLHKYLQSDLPEIDRCMDQKLDLIAKERIQKCVMRADNDYISSPHRNAGSTAVFALARKLAGSADSYKVAVGNVGDSRCVLGKIGGRIVHMTEDHKPTLEREHRRIYKAGGFVKNSRVCGRLALSRAIGDYSYKREDGLSKMQQQVIACPDVTFDYVGKSDFLLLCCDGIFDVMSGPQAVSFIQSQLDNTDDLALILSRLLDHCLGARSGDNMSALLVQFKDGDGFECQDEFIPGPIHSIDSEWQERYKQNALHHGFPLSNAALGKLGLS